ncbi:MAG: acyl-CoA dehydrogenase family protein [Bacteroidales bacterium]
MNLVLSGRFIPGQYGGAGMDFISYGLIMQELEAGDSEHSVYGIGSNKPCDVSNL